MRFFLFATLFTVLSLIAQAGYTQTTSEDTAKLQEFSKELEEVENLRNQRKLPQALAMVDSLLKVFPSDTINITYVRGLHLKGIIYNEMTYYKKGLTSLENAIKILEKIPGNLSYQAMLEKKIITLPSTSKLESKVLHYGKRAIKHYKQLNDYTNIALTYSDLAVFLGHNNQYELGFYYSDLAKEYFEMAPNPSKHQAIDFEKHLASLYAKYDPKTSLKHRKKIYNINKSISPNNPETAWTAAQLGWGYMEREKYDSAKMYLSTGLNILKKYYPDKSPTLAHVFLALGEIYIYLNQPDSALFYLDKTKRNYESVSPNYYWLNTVYQLYAKLSEKQNNYLQAIKHIHKSLYFTIDSVEANDNIFTTPPLEKCKGQDITKHVLIKKTYLFKKLFKENGDPKYLEASIKFGLLTNDYLLEHSYDQSLTENQLNKYLYVTLERAMVSNIQSLQLAEKEKNKNQLVRKVYNGLSKAKAFLLQKDLHTIKTYKHDTANQIFARIHSTKNKIRELEYKIKNTKDEAALKKQKEILAELYLNVFLDNKQLDKYAQTTKHFQATANNGDFNPNEILSEDEAIVDYFYNDSILAVFVVTNNAINLEVQIVDENFTQTLQKYYRHLKTSSAQLKVSSLEISEYLFEPIYNYIKQKKKLIIIPYGKLHQIPFEPLPVKKSKKMLIEKYAVSYNYSSKLIQDKKKDENLSLTAFAPGFISDNQAKVPDEIALRTDSLFYRDPIQRKSGQYLAPLPYSTEEVNKISETLANQNIKVKIFKGKHATESVFKEYVQKSDIIHVATHGYTSLNKPELTGLFFSKTEKQSDGYLYLHELYSQTTNADLVVLSACKSGSGKSIQNEGALALPRGFLAIGANNILASLWKIHDERTKKLMVLFYEKMLKNGGDYRKALQDAKLECIKEGFLPMDWAGFVLIGN